MGQVFVGRRGELEALCARLEEAHSGRPRVVLVEGPAGIGKSRLVAQFLCSAEGEGLRVLRATADEQESTLAYGVVDQLLAEATELGVEAAKPGPGGWGAEPLMVGARLVEVLGEAQADGSSVVVVVDDAHWADLPSLQALTFAVRRLRVDRVLTLVATREEGVERLPEGLRRVVDGERGLRLRLGGLDARQLQRLAAAALGDTEITAEMAQRLRAHTSGNPLYARALLEEMPPHLLFERELVLPAPRSFALLVVNRLAGCSRSTQELVAAAAVLGARVPLSHAATVADLSEPLGPLQEAVTAPLLVEDTHRTAARTVGFPHPLVRAAVYHDLRPAHRSMLHTRAAHVVREYGAALRHRVLASPGEDATLATEVAKFAREQAARGILASGAAHLLLATQVTPSETDREQLVGEAVELMILGGEVSRARSYLPELSGFTDSPQRRHTLGLLAMMEGRLGEAEQLQLAAWQDCNPSQNPDHAARIAEQLAALCILAGRAQEAAEWSRRGLTLHPTDPRLTASLQFHLAVGLGIGGRAQEGLRLLASKPFSPGELLPQDVATLVGRGLLKLWTDDLQGARDDLSPVVDMENPGSIFLRFLALEVLAETEYRQGAWDDAIVHGHLAASTAEDAEHLWMLPSLHGVASYPLSARGEWEIAESHVQAAATIADMLGDEASLSYSRTAAAALAQARGNSQAVVDALAPLLQLPTTAGIYEPGVLPWREMLVDALTSLGQIEEAEAVLAPFEAIAAERQRHSSLTDAARNRGNLEAAKGNPQAAQEAFSRGFEHAEQVSLLPFDRALLELSYGAFLRRAGQRRAAVAQLQSARSTLADLQARPYLDRCEQELAACGLTPGKRRERDATRLTPQELAVARLVASGHSNREAAAQLVVSARTVEYHLRNVYAKFGVTSRTQLAASFATHPHGET